MPALTIVVLGQWVTVELDRDGRIEGVGNSVGPDFTVVSELPIALREALAAKIRIVRHNVILPDNRPHTYLRGCIKGHDCNGRDINELLAAYAARVECIDYVADPVDAARRASIILAGDKGYANHIESNNGRDYDVVADNGKRFRFCQERSY